MHRSFSLLWNPKQVFYLLFLQFCELPSDACGAFDYIRSKINCAIVQRNLGVVVRNHKVILGEIS